MNTRKGDFNAYLNFKREWTIRPGRKRGCMVKCTRFVLRFLKRIISKRPYLAMIHSVLSFPLGTLYFSLIWTLITTGSIGILLFGFGFLLLFLAAGTIRLMTHLEVFLARTLLQLPIRASLSSLSVTEDQSMSKNWIHNSNSNNAINYEAANGGTSGAVVVVGGVQPVGGGASANPIKNHERWRDRIANFIFCADTGYGLLYSVVKLPVSMITCGITMLCLSLFMFMFTSPFLRIVCQAQLGHSCFHTQALQLGKTLDWLLWIFDSLPGTIILIILSIALMPLFLFIVEKASYLSHSAVTVIGDPDSTAEYEKIP